MSLSINSQKIFCDKFQIDTKTAKKLHKTAGSNGKIDRDTVRKIIFGEDNVEIQAENVKISSAAYTRYFSENAKAKEVTETIEKALEFYFVNAENE